MLCSKYQRCYFNKQARYRRQSALQKYNCETPASNIALSYGVDVDNDHLSVLRHYVCT